ncbi:MAG: CinA family protein [Bacillota bacterium]|jgi:PncC family amidohydrolase
MPLFFGLSSRDFSSPDLDPRPHPLGVYLRLPRPLIRQVWQAYYPHWQLTLANPAQKLVSLLGEKKLTLATAESATAGAIASAIADIPGASRVLLGGVVAYTARAKNELLGLVPADLSPGCVGKELSEKMAGAVKDALQADLAIGLTGALGPTSPAPEIPVGTVYIAVAGWGAWEARKFIFTGDRETNKKAAVAAGLNFLLTFFARWYVA